MNRTALCIRMLALLKVRGRMRIDEIAEALETNPRNVREFRKETGITPIETTILEPDGFEKLVRRLVRLLKPKPNTAGRPPAWSTAPASSHTTVVSPTAEKKEIRPSCSNAIPNHLGTVYAPPALRVNPPPG